MHHFKSFNQVMSTQNVKMCFIKGNELKLTQVELFLFIFFKGINVKFEMQY